MKAALSAIPDKYIYSAYVGDRPLASIYHGKEKIWPDNSQRVTRMTLDIAALAGTLNGTYWTLALEAIETGCNAQKFIRLTADRTYNVNKTFGTYPLVYYQGNGTFSFIDQQGPIARNVRPGLTVKMRLVIPSRASMRIGGDQPNIWPVSHHYPPLLPGTVARGYFSKGQKKVSTGAALRVESQPSGIVQLNMHQQQNGHCRGYRDWSYGTLDPIAGDTQILLTVTPHQPRGSWGGYFVYPNYNVTFNLKILRIETTA